MKRKIFLISMVLMLFVGVATASSLHGEFDGDSIVRVTTSGKDLTIQDVPAVNRDGRTLIPVYLLKQLGVGVTWNQDTYTADVTIPKSKDLTDLLTQFGNTVITNASIGMDGSGKKTLSIISTIDFSNAQSNTIYSSLLFAVQDYDVSEFDLQYLNGKISFNISDIRDFNSLKINGDELNKRALSSTTSGNTKPILTASDIAKLTNGIGVIYTFDQYNKPIAQGSGFMIAPIGLMVTNHHVISGSNHETIKINGQTYQSHFYAFDNPTTDLYGVAINTDEQGKYKNDIKFPYLTLNTTLPKVGDKVYAVGSPKDLENTISEGIVSGIRSVNGVTMIQHTANTDHGSSGGVLLNEYGEVIGVTSAGFDGTSLDFAIAASYVQDELDKLK